MSLNFYKILEKELQLIDKEIDFLNKVFVYELEFRRNNAIYKGYLVLAEFDYHFLESRKSLFLTKNQLAFLESEENFFVRYKYLQVNFLITYLNVIKPFEISPKRIQIRKGVFGNPLLDGPWELTVSHSAGLVALLFFPDEHPVGIDIEEIKNDAVEKISSQLTSKEVENLKKLNEPTSISYTRLWTVKESLSKILKVGITIPFSILETKVTEIGTGYVVFEFENFLQYQSISFQLRNFIISISLPQASQLSIKKI